MKLTINPNEIASTLRKAERVVSSKNLISILDNFLITVADGSKMTLTAFDNEVLVNVSLPIVSSDGGFKFCVNAKKFSQVVAGINGELTIELDGNATLNGKHKKGKFNLSYLNGDEFPVTEIKPEHTMLMTKVGHISNTLASVSYAVSNDALHPTLTGVYFDFNENGYTGVATDTRMMICEKVNIGDCSAMQPIIVPAKAATIIRSFIEQVNSDDDIAIYNDGSIVKIKLDERFEIVFRQINGRFPAYEKVIPTNNDKTATINRKDFLDSLARIILFAPTTSPVVRLHFTPTMVEMTTQDLDYNMSSTENVDCTYSGDDFTIGFNASSLQTILSNFQSEDIRIMMSESNRAALIYPNDDNVLALVMPMLVE